MKLWGWLSAQTLKPGRTPLVNPALTTNEALSPEQTLALAYAPLRARDALAAVWELDARMRRLFARAREPALSQIKLAWWQERLAELSPGSVPSEPLLRRLARIGEPERLAAIPDGWRELAVGEAWTAAAIDAHASLRGRALIDLAGAILGARAGERMLLAGEGGALLGLLPLAPDDASRDRARHAARLRFVRSGRFTWPRAMRPAGMLVTLARRDAGRTGEPRPGSPARVGRMAWHALTGR